MLGLRLSMKHKGLDQPLYTVDQVPEDFHEHYIVRGYRRPRSSFTQCLWSLAQPTNETLNFWTHFLPFWYFAWLTFTFSYTMDFKNDSYTWPFLCYLLTCCLFPLVSAVAHLFNVMSSSARHICFFMDYAALSIYSCGCGIVYRAYCFPAIMLSPDPEPEVGQEGRGSGGFLSFYRNYFVTIAIFNSILCTTLSCRSRFSKASPLQKMMRIGSFAVPYIFDVIPLIIRLCIHQSTSAPSSSSNLEGISKEVEDAQIILSADYYHLRQFFYIALSAFLYASHLPEKILPGIFDIVGQSHQLFHVATVIGLCVQVQSIVLDFHERREFLISAGWGFDSPYRSLGVLAFVVVCNCCVVVYFALNVLNIKNNNNNSNKNRNDTREKSK